MLLGLAYLEWRNAAHQAAAILRSPLRLVLWGLYALSFGYFTYARAFAAPTSLSRPFGATATEIATGLFAGAIGLTVVRASTGRVFAFRNPAEPVVFSNAGVRPLNIALWLQLRKLAASGGRSLGGVAYFYIVFASGGVGPAANARILVAALLALALQLSVELPAFLLARTRLRIPLLGVGCTLAAAGFAFGALALFAPHYVAPAVRILHFDPGGLATALASGNAWAFIGLAVLLGALYAVVALLGNDALPELYAASQATLVWRRRAGRARRGARSSFRVTGSRESARVPSGALTLVWKDWVGFRRGPASLRLWLAGAGLCAALGAAAGLLSNVTRDPGPTISLGAVAGLVLLALAPLGSSLALANDLAKPLFWFSKAPLEARLTASTFARTWRTGLALGCGPLAAGIVAGNVTLATAALPVCLASYWSLQALGVGLFALFPNPVDSRGPMTLVRLLATGVYLLPALLVAIVVGALGGPPLFVALAGASVLALQGRLAIVLAALRFLERGASFAISARPS